MKEIKAYIQPFMLQKVTNALHKIHVRGMSVTEIKGFGKEKDESYPHHSGDYVVEFTPKIKVEIVCKDEEVDEIVQAIRKSAHTGRQGDGKVIVSNVETAYSIRSENINEQAI